MNWSVWSAPSLLPVFSCHTRHSIGLTATMHRIPHLRSNKYIAVKATVVQPSGEDGFLQKSGQEYRGGIKFHVHPQLQLDAQTIFDSAINIGSSNANDLMCYKLLQKCEASELPGGITSFLEGLEVGINPLDVGLDYVAHGVTESRGWFEAPPLKLPEARYRYYDSEKLLHEALQKDSHVRLLDKIFTQAAIARETVYVLGYERHQSCSVES